MLLLTFPLFSNSYFWLSWYSFNLLLSFGVAQFTCNIKTLSRIFWLLLLQIIWFRTFQKIRFIFINERHQACRTKSKNTKKKTNHLLCPSQSVRVIKCISTSLSSDLIQVLLLLSTHFRDFTKSIDVKQLLFSPVCEQKRPRLKLH